MTNDPDRARVLLALADRVEREDLTETLLIEIRDAAFPAPRGYGGPYERWQHNQAAMGRLIRGGHYLEFAAGLLSARWSVLIHADPKKCAVMVSLDFTDAKRKSYGSEAPTEPRARTAAALRAMAVEVGE